jgi:hypothetical protein
MWINGELAHGKHDLDSIAQPSFFAPRDVLFGPGVNPLEGSPN